MTDTQHTRTSAPDERRGRELGAGNRILALFVLAGVALGTGLALNPVDASASSTPYAAAVAAETSGAQQSVPTATAPGPVLDDDGSACATEGQCDDLQAARLANYYDSPYRLWNRWADATEGFFTKYDGFIGTQVGEMAQRNLVQGTQLGIGNFLMGTAGNAIYLVSNLDLVSAAGRQIDQLVAAVSQIVVNATGSGAATVLFVAILVVAVAVAAVSAARHGGVAMFLRRFLGTALIAGTLVGMAFASQQSASSADGSAPYSPTPGTPTWVVKTVADGVGMVADAPARALIDASEPLAALSREESDADPLSCDVYVENVRDRLDGLRQRAGHTSAIVGSFDTLWEQTGLVLWAQMQTGSYGGDINPVGGRVYCRILDMRSSVGSPVSDAANTAWMAGDWREAIRAAASKAPFSASRNNDQQVSIVAWAACAPVSVSGTDIRWEWAPEWVGFRGAANFTPSNADTLCDRWWTAAPGDDLPDEFDVTGEMGWIVDNTREIAATADRTAVMNFLASLTGVAPVGGLGSWAYLVGALFTLGAMGWLAALVLFAKLMMVFFAVTLWFLLVRALFSSNPVGDVLGPQFRRFLGSTVFATVMAVVLMLVVVISRVLTEVGNSVFSSVSGFALLWAGLCPALAIVVLHFVFTKVVKVASPLSIGGARGWVESAGRGRLGGALLATGGAIAGSVMGPGGVKGALGRGLRAAVSSARGNSKAQLAKRKSLMDVASTDPAKTPGGDPETQGSAPQAPGGSTGPGGPGAQDSGVRSQMGGQVSGVRTGDSPARRSVSATRVALQRRQAQSTLGVSNMPIQLSAAAAEAGDVVNAPRGISAAQSAAAASARRMARQEDRRYASEMRQTAARAQLAAVSTVQAPVAVQSRARVGGAIDPAAHLFNAPPVRRIGARRVTTAPRSGEPITARPNPTTPSE